MSKKLVLHLVLSPAIAFLLGAGMGRFTAPTPTLPLPVPNNEQLTIAASTLVHGLEVQNDYSLATAPDFVGCHQTKAGGLACDFQVTYFDESGATWELVLSRKNIPTLIRRLKSRPAPPAG